MSVIDPKYSNITILSPITIVSTIDPTSVGQSPKSDFKCGQL